MGSELDGQSSAAPGLPEVNIAGAPIDTAHGVAAEFHVSAPLLSAAQLLLDLAAQDWRALQRRIRHYCGPAPLCLDELGYLSYDARNADLLFRVISCRYEYKSIVNDHQPGPGLPEVNDIAGALVAAVHPAANELQVPAPSAFEPRRRVAAGPTAEPDQRGACGSSAGARPGATAATRSGSGRETGATAPASMRSDAAGAIGGAGRCSLVSVALDQEHDVRRSEVQRVRRHVSRKVTRLRATTMA